MARREGEGVQAGENGDVTVKTVSVAAALAVEAERGVVAGERRWGR